jgi:hypothetical protein
LSDWLWGQEVALGPVIAIGNNGQATAATFRFSLTEPTKKATIREMVGDTAVIPADATEACRGTVFLSAQLKQVVVYR